MAVPPSEEILRQVPAPVAELLRKMLAKAPEDRFQSPLELSQTLDQLLKEVESIAATTSVTVPWDRTSRHFRIYLFYRADHRQPLRSQAKVERRYVSVSSG